MDNLYWADLPFRKIFSKPTTPKNNLLWAGLPFKTIYSTLTKNLLTWLTLSRPTGIPNRPKTLPGHTTWVTYSEKTSPPPPRWHTARWRNWRRPSAYTSSRPSPRGWCWILWRHSCSAPRWWEGVALPCTPGSAHSPATYNIFFVRMFWCVFYPQKFSLL